MSSLDIIRQVRIDKLNKMRKKGINPYPAKTLRTHSCQQAIDNFDDLSKKEKEIVLAGRIMAIRVHGGSTFVNITDGTDKIQIYLKLDEVGEKEYQNFQDNFDVGDFIDVTGNLFSTKREEKTLLVKKYSILAKSILPLPEKWHGLKDIEERFRKRYLDILFDSEVKDLFIKKSKFWNVTRNFLLDKGFLEVETPVLENTAGGAEAKPFITHHNALDMDVFLRISMGELWQKRLMVAGFEKTFEIGRQFRNEGMSDEHLQEYTQMEFYWAYADYNDGMKLVKELYTKIAQEVFGTLRFKIRGFDVDFGGEWKTYKYAEVIKEKTGIDINKTDIKSIEEKLQELGIKYDKEGFNLNRAIDNLWKYCRKDIAGPGFLIDIPALMEPLAKRDEQNLEVVQRFQPIIAGSELGKGYSELNDPIDQAERFAKQQELREKGDEEAQMYDKDFIEALEYGMPPTCGFGMSERLFAFLMDKSIRECQIFPLMKPKE